MAEETNGMMLSTMGRGMRTSGPALFDGFPCFVFQRNQKGELERVPWESDWKKIRDFVDRREHRGGQRRQLQSREGVDFCVLLGKPTRKGERRKPSEERKGSERRNPLRLRFVFKSFLTGWLYLRIFLAARILTTN